MYQDKLKIEKMNLFGIFLLFEIECFYLNGNFVLYLIGRVQKNLDIGEFKGVFGVEKIFDSYLSGFKGLLRYIYDIWGYIVLNIKKEKQFKCGDDVYLIIDLNI